MPRTLAEDTNFRDALQRLSAPIFIAGEWRVVGCYRQVSRKQSSHTFQQKPQMILLILQALWKPKGAAQNLIGVQMCPVHTTNDPEIIGLGRLGAGWKLILKGVKNPLRRLPATPLREKWRAFHGLLGCICSRRKCSRKSAFLHCESF